MEDNAELVKEAVDEKDAEAVGEELAKAKRRRLAEAGRTTPTPPRPGPSAAAPAPASGEGASSSAPYDRIRVAVPPTHFSQEQAAAMLPQAKGTTISPVNGRQWQVKYKARPRRPYSHSVTYDPEGPAGLDNHRKALLECLEWVWQVHVECGGAACPNDLRQLVGLE